MRWPGAVELARPMWLSALAFGTLMTVLVCWPTWPGHFGYDGLFAYEESLRGITTMTWPPLHAYLFWLSRKAGAGVGGVYVMQTFLLFAGAGLVIGQIVGRRAWSWGAMAAFAIAFVAVPPLLGIVIVQWRDITVASFCMASLALWLAAAHHRAFLLFTLSALALGLSLALRYNAFPLFALTAPLMVWRPYLQPGASMRLRAAAFAVLALFVALAVASTQWRLPDFHRPPQARTLATIQLFDLLGISACSGKVYVPIGVTDGWPITVGQIRTAYSPKHVNMAYDPYDGQPRILPTEAHGRVAEAWGRAVREQPGCYLAHRTAVFAEQMGLVAGEVFLPTHTGIDENPHGIRLAHPGASRAVTNWVVREAPRRWRRPIWLYVGAVLITLGLLLRRSSAATLATALTGGALANCALLFLIGPAADARYIFPSNVVCALVMAAGGAVLLARRREPSDVRTG